jgi:hypothetical protein
VVRRCFWLAFVGLLAGCGTARGQAPPVQATGGAASCAALSPAAQLARARVVFVGVMLPGAVAHVGGRSVLASPARMRVGRYLKGQGPRSVTVRTAVSIEGGAITVTEDGIEPQAGQRWEIYTDSQGEPFDTSICAGSARVAPRPQRSPGAAALALWRRFPVDAKPRPIVPLGEGVVLAPSSGFGAGAAKLAYMESRFVLHAELPHRPVSAGRFHLVSAAAAYRRLRAGGVNQHQAVAPLVISAVKPGSATFLTDRGRMRLPVWFFFFKGVADPASVLALGAPNLFIAAPAFRSGASGPGSTDVSATRSASGKAITLSFAGGPAGNAPCDERYRASAVADRQAVAFTITTIAVPVPAGQACPALAVVRTAVLHLGRPLGARVLVSASDGGAVPVTSAR